MFDLLTAARVGEFLGLDRSTVYRMAADGRLPAVKIGRQWRFRAADVEALVDGAASGGRDLGSATADLPIPRDVATAVVQVAATSLGVMMVVTDMDGRPLTPIANPCPSFEAVASDPLAIRSCAEEWRHLADDPELRPRFVTGGLGFQCARAFIRIGRELVGMLLAGGVAPPGERAFGVYELDDAGRERVLDALPTLAATISRLRKEPLATAAPRRRVSI